MLHYTLGAEHKIDSRVLPFSMHSRSGAAIARPIAILAQCRTIHIPDSCPSNHVSSGNALAGSAACQALWIHVLHGHKRPPCMTHDLDWDVRVWETVVHDAADTCHLSGRAGSARWKGCRHNHLVPFQCLGYQHGQGQRNGKGIVGCIVAVQRSESCSCICEMQG
jgi:hypothetical protein